MRSLKPKTCRWCKQVFQPQRSMQSVCCFRCGLNYAHGKREAKALTDTKKAAKALRTSLRARKEAIKTTNEWAKDLQALVNRYVRLRDADDGCISCDKPASWNGQWHASHYYPTISSAVRFNLWNIHKSCSVCNSHLSSNREGYRPRIIEKIGEERFDWLERNHSNITKYDIDWLKRAIKIARKGVKRMEKRMRDG